MCISRFDSGSDGCALWNGVRRKEEWRSRGDDNQLSRLLDRRQAGQRLCKAEHESGSRVKWKCEGSTASC